MQAAYKHLSEPLYVTNVVRQGDSGDSKGAWVAMAATDFWLAFCLTTQFFLNFPFKFAWLTYAVENCRLSASNILNNNLETL